MSYCPESSGIDYHHNASYQLDVHIPRQRLRALIEPVSQRRIPSQISVEIGDTQGMKYDWQPDGSAKIWDNKNSSQIPIKAVSFMIPLIGGDPYDFLDDRSIEDGMPPSYAQLNQIT